MSVAALLHKTLSVSLSHKGRINGVIQAVEALITGDKLTLTGLGRNIDNENTVKSNIKKMDYLIGNSLLHNDRVAVYRELVKQICDDNKNLIIAVDWSDTHIASDTQMLCATIVMPGRGITSYEKCYPTRLYNSQKAHKDFVNELSQILPKDSKPIIITDAASSFGVHWFKLIESHGWYWLGRVRKGPHHFTINKGEIKHSELSDAATRKARRYEEATFTKRHKHPCTITTVKRKLTTQPHVKSRTRRSHRHQTTKYKRGAKESWILLSSPELKIHREEVIALYAMRMTIEEKFRDTKDLNYGSGLLVSRSKSVLRIDNLLLIDSLAKFVLWGVGFMAEEANLARYFQANTVRSHRVLSVIRLGKEILSKKFWAKKLGDIREDILIFHINNNLRCY